ncbi:hypothetical protein IRJ41_004565 [Triplophysa rosa]|uniref:Uncharacterized protein n=1 Tax=Triplophysa rosa TaxID=992332 RepID=A0A9W7TIN9_TRIRA|nr:hypothetical protein IRJ41_004565 [Triplophysa rosa]
MACFETAEAEIAFEDIQPLTSWADSLDDEDDEGEVSDVPYIPSWAIMDVTEEAAIDPEPSPAVPERANIPSSQRQDSGRRETSTRNVTPASPPQKKSSTLVKPDPPKSETLVPPGPAAVPKTASSQSQEINGQETSTKPISPASPPQQESPAQRLDEPDPVKSEPLVPPVDAAVPKTVLKSQEIAGEETQRQEANDTDTSVEDLCERLEEVHLSSKPPARATQSPVPERLQIGLNSSSPFHRLNPLRPATFIFYLPSTFEIEHLCERLDEFHLSSKPLASPRPSPPVPERHSSIPFNPLKPLHLATFVFEIPSTLAEIEYFCERLDEFHLSSKVPAAHRPSPVPEHHQLGSNSSSSFNPLKPLRPAKFIFESSFEIEHLRKLLEEVHLSSKLTAAPRPSPVPERHHLGSANIHGASSFNRLKPLRPAKFLFDSPSAFRFGQEQKSDCQMSGQERSIEPPVTADPRTTPSPSHQEDKNGHS